MYSFFISTDLISFLFMLMCGSEKSHIAPILSRTGFPMFMEFAFPAIMKNDPKDNVIALNGSENNRGYLRIPSTHNDVLSAEVILTLVLFSFKVF